MGEGRPTNDPRDPRRLTEAAGLCGVLTGVVGALVLMGWTFDIPLLMTVLPGTVSMKANTALGFMLAGASLALLARPGTSGGRVWVGRVLAVAVVVIGGLTLAQYVWGWSLGIDELLFKDTTAAVATVIPGRMAPSTALSFLLLGVALLISDLEPRRGFRPAEWLAVPVAMIGLISVVEYAVGHEILYSFQQYTRMALHTAVVFIVLSVGVVLSRPASGAVGAIRAGMTGPLERRVYAALILGFLVLAVLGTASFFNAQESLARARSTVHCTQVRTELAMLLSTLQAVESGARGYVVTGDERYLKPYKEAVAAVDGRRAVLESLLEDTTEHAQHAEQGERLRRLESAVRARVDSAGRVVEARRTKGFDEAVRLIASGEGKRLMDSIRAAVRLMDQEEAGLLDARRRAEGASAARLNATIVGGTMLGLTIVVLATVVVHRDLVRRHEAEEALVGANAELKAQIEARERAETERSRLFQYSTDMLCIASLEGYFLELNPAWEKVLGWTDEELKARPYIDFVHPDDVQATANAAADLTESRPVFRFENRYRSKDGSYRWLAWNSFPVVEDGVTYAVARDVTEARAIQDHIVRLNADLQSRTSELEQTNSELESFSYSVSHDLRAPLRSIDGFSLALLEDYRERLDDCGSDYLRRVRAASQRMGQLIDDLLALSRTTRGPMRIESVDITGIARAVSQRLMAAESGRRVDLTVAEGLAALGDERLISYALENLLGNALKFTGTRKKARIEVGVADVDGERAFFVRDNGVGFDMAYADKLFGAFQRLHATDEFPGTGVGLATVQRIVHRHGGRVWAEAGEGKGATFYFTLGRDGPVPRADDSQARSGEGVTHD